MLYHCVTRGLLAVVLLLGTAIILQPSTVAAQEQPPGQPIEIYAAGGLLGFVDGFPEYTGRPGEKPPEPSGVTETADGPKRVIDSTKPIEYGGLVGLTQRLNARSLESVLLLTGNNHPQRLHHTRFASATGWPPNAPRDWFWSQIAALRPQAIALGTEDMHRLLAQMPPQKLAQWLKSAIADKNCSGASCLPFLATNAIVKYSGDHLNLVADKATGIRLEVPETESIGFTNKLQLAHPCKPFRNLPVKAFRFEEADAPTIDLAGDGEAVLGRADDDKDDICRTALTLKERLRPGRTYTLLGPGVTSAGFAFRFKTHETLTPYQGPGSWNGLPVIRLDRGPVPIAIMSFVTPEVAGELPPSLAEWSGADGCPAETCRLEFLPPADVARAMLELAAQPKVPTPLLLTMTDLLEDEADALLDALPEARFVTVQPESLRLGRAATALEAAKRGELDKKNYSGDLSFVGVVDGSDPVAARVIARPEWIGEVLSHAQMRVWRSESEEAWALTSITADSIPVLGATLKALSSGDRVRYKAVYHPTLPEVDADPDEYNRYCDLNPNGPFERSTKKQSRLWTDRGDTLGLLLDTMRERARSDVAVVPESWVDNDVIRWLRSKQNEITAPDRIDWLSGFILQRALFRVERIVTISVDAATISSLLQKIVAASAEWGDPLCASGVGDVGCPLAKLDTVDLMLNRRRLQPGHYYKLALPAGLAREHGLTFDEEQTVDILGPIDARLAGCTPGPAQEDDRSLRSRLELERSGRIQRYLKLDPLSFEYAVTGVHEPEGADGLFAKLPLESSSAKDNTLITADLKADIAPIDTRRWALRMPVSIEFTRKELEDIRSYDRDDYVVGVRGDYKRLIKGIARVFVGAFVEGDFEDRREQVSATRTIAEIEDPERPGQVLTNVTATGPTLTFVTNRQRFVYLSGGGELTKLERSWGAINDIRLSVDYGRAYNVPISVVLAEHEHSLEDFRRLGASGLLKSVYQEDLDGINEGSNFGFRYTDRPRLRFQADGTVEIKTGGKRKLSIANRARYYNQLGDEPLLVTRWAWKSTIGWEIPISRRWSVGPYYEVQLVQAKGVDGIFRVSQGGIKITWTTFLKSGHGFVFD